MEKIKLLLYCTKSNKKLFYDVVSQKYMYGLNGKNDKFNSLNGKIVAECDFEVEEISKVKDVYGDTYFYDTPTLYYDELLKKSCLNNNQLEDYIEFKGYAIHIKNLNIFDEPKELEYFESYKDDNYNVIEKAPQNMMYAYYITKNYADTIYEKPFVRYTYDKYILISIRAEWLCKILNKEKTIEVRKKVLKEMINDA